MVTGNNPPNPPVSGESPLEWYSSMCRFAVLVEGHGMQNWHDSLYLFRATGWDAAFLRALELGRANETTYSNSDGEKVRWALAEVVSIDPLGPEISEGAEVYSGPIFESDPSLAWDHAFTPEKSMPTQTF